MKQPKLPDVPPPPLPPSAPAYTNPAGAKPVGSSLLTTPTARPPAQTQRRTLLGGM